MIAAPGPGRWLQSHDKFLDLCPIVSYRSLELLSGIVAYLLVTLQLCHSATLHSWFPDGRFTPLPLPTNAASPCSARAVRPAFLDLLLGPL